MISHEGKETIRQILIEELNLAPQPVPEQLALLRQRVSGDRASYLAKLKEPGFHGDLLGEQRLFAAIASGVGTLLHPHDYYATQSGYEITYAFAALVLIDRIPENSLVFHTNNWSPRLREALTPYILRSTA